MAAQYYGINDKYYTLSAEGSTLKNSSGAALPMFQNVSESDIIGNAGDKPGGGAYDLQGALGASGGFQKLDPIRGKVDFPMGEAKSKPNITLSGLSQESNDSYHALSRQCPFEARSQGGHPFILKITHNTKHGMASRGPYSLPFFPSSLHERRLSPNEV